jgi:digeranylgeranylglycerophospholipid reductase
MEDAKLRDVVIVGAGPIGCFTAALLAEKGFDALVLERNPSAGHGVVCAGLIGAEAFDRFRLPRGPVINRIQDVTFFSPSGIRFSYRAEDPMAFMVDRREFDRNMADMAMSFGAEVRCNSLVRDMRLGRNGLILEVESPEGEYDLRAKMAVVACGFNPQLTQRLGLDSPTEWLEGAEVLLDVNGVRETEIHVGRDIAPGSFAWVVPMNSEKARVGVTTEENADLFLRSFLNKPVIRDRIESHNLQINVDLIPMRPIEKSFRERVLVVGEAAGQVKSTTCGGIYYGLISAGLAAETIEEAFCKNRFDDAILKRYEQQWRRELGGELEIGYRFRQIFSKIRDRQIDRLFEILNSDGIGHIIRRKAQFDWHKDLILALARHAVMEKYLHPITVLARGALK